MLKRKIDIYLKEWKKNKNHKPLIVYGTHQIGKTTSIRKLGKTYKSFIEINFNTTPKYKSYFESDYTLDLIIMFMNIEKQSFNFIDNNTLIFLDEVEDCKTIFNTLKTFNEDKRFDIICSCSSFKNTSNTHLDFIEEYKMYPMDFEEFLWANGYNNDLIDTLYNYMKNLEKLPDCYMIKLSELYRDYIFIGGMPEVVNSFINTHLFTNPFNIQKRIIKNYEDYLTKNVLGLDIKKAKTIYKNIYPQLAKDNHKFQISQIGKNIRIRDYKGIKEYLEELGIVNIIYNLKELKEPISLYKNLNYYRLYFTDHFLFMSLLDEESRKNLIFNNNFEIFNGALYESLVSEDLVKLGYELYFYKSYDATVEIDFIIKVKDKIIPIEVKNNRGRSKSLNSILNQYDMNLGITFSNNNIGYSNNKINFPYFLTFLLKRFLKEIDLTKM